MLTTRRQCAGATKERSAALQLRAQRRSTGLQLRAQPWGQCACFLLTWCATRRPHRWLSRFTESRPAEQQAAAGRTIIRNRTQNPQLSIKYDVRARLAVRTVLCLIRTRALLAVSNPRKTILKNYLSARAARPTDKKRERYPALSHRVHGKRISARHPLQGDAGKLLCALRLGPAKHTTHLCRPGLAPVLHLGSVPAGRRAI